MVDDPNVGDEPPIDNPPAAPQRRRHRKTNTGNGAKKSRAGSTNQIIRDAKKIVKAEPRSHLKLIDDMKAAAAPAADPLNRDPASSGPDPYDLDAAVYNQDYLDEAATEAIDRPIKTRKPGRKEWFRVLPYFRRYNLFVDDEGDNIDKDFYIVMPSMAVAMEDETFLADLRLCVNSHGISFFWPNRVPDEGRTSSWVDSAREAAKEAETRWIRMKANQKQGAGHYDLRAAKGDFGEPEFTATDADGYKRLLDASIPRERRIATNDHPIFYNKVEARKK